MKDFSARVISNIEYFVCIKQREIWIRRTELETAEREFLRLQEEGRIKSVKFRPEWSCNGSANFLVEYPS